ncbi:M20/M25/M40 family metallo-hydrolase [Bryobacter aggregatus]|uniref:M20/M25/M40 family metallo-hydrolase n=1 Tax=Bryobacter aggregatus TaxID=360054 RepID=UPI0004E1A048|nr:M20/M25/M40 family metallo-hydrolase [Bryobacter aggregatus]
MSRLRYSILFLAMLGFAAKLPDGIDGRRMVDDVRLLSNEKYKGRWTGTKELDEAARWIAHNYEKMGLKAPFADASGKLSFFQKFVVNTESKLGTHNTLSVGSEKLSVAKDFLPRIFSSSGEVSAPLVFAGYGITAHEYHYDDYAGLDVKGKIVVVLRLEPQDGDQNSVFLGTERTRHANLEGKAINAKLHGAAGMIVLNNTAVFPGEENKLDPFGNESGPLSVGIPVVQVKTSIAEKWIAAAGHDLKAMVRTIDQNLEPQSFAFPDSLHGHLRVDINRIMKPTWNVAAYLPGETSEYIVIGAHYDHLGVGRQFSMAPSEAGKIHPGADDNASGTAAVLELARHFKSLPKPKRGILFAHFSGEELGLLGSSYMTAHMPLDLANCTSMVNLDMIGRMTNGKLFIAGAASGSGFQSILENLLQADPAIHPDFSENLNIGGSDHTSFSSKQIPTLFFFTGLHPDYHKPSDTWEKFDPVAYQQVVRLVAATVSELEAAPKRPEFRRVETAAAPSGGGGGYGPYFGSVPDFAEVSNGVRFADVRAGSPAEKGGIRAGDVLTEFDGKKVASLQDYTYLLRAKKPGDTVRVKVNRFDQSYEFSVVLGIRK